MGKSSKEYSQEELMELGRMNVKEGKSIREIAQKLGVSNSTVSKAKVMYTAYQEGKSEGKDEKEREMEDRVNRLKNRIEKLSSRSKGDEETDNSGIDLRDYARDQDQGKDNGQGDDEPGWGWGVAGLGTLAALGVMAYKHFRD